VGEGRRSFRLEILRKGLVDIPLMFVLATLVPVYGIVAATPLTDALCCLVACIMLARYLKKLEKKTEHL
jgi:Na+-driven multidrug efflux pump